MPNGVYRGGVLVPRANPATVKPRNRVYIDHVVIPNATTQMIREAVTAGKLVVAVDDAGCAVQIDRTILAQIDRRTKYSKPSGATPA